MEMGCFDICSMFTTMLHYVSPTVHKLQRVFHLTNCKLNGHAGVADWWMDAHCIRVKMNFTQ